MMKRMLAICVVLGLGLATLVNSQPLNGTGFFQRVVLGTTSVSPGVQSGTGTPEAAVTASVGELFLRSDGADGTTLYVKASGSATNTGWIPLISAPSTKTLTGTTLDAEGTGNAITVPFTKWINAAICNNVTASAPDWSFPTTNPAVPACQTGTNTQYGTLDFADGANVLSAQTHLMLSSDWTGTIGAKFKWFTSATTGAVVWQIATICVADAETSDPAFNTASTVTDTAKGTTLQLNDASIASVTITGCAAGELMYVRVFRDPATGADTLAATARLVGVELTYRRAL